MAAKTPDSVITESLGSLTLKIATFSTNDIDDGDTWDTGLSGKIVGYWANATDDPTQTKEGIDCSESAGVITFNTGEDNRTGMVYVLVKGL